MDGTTYSARCAVLTVESRPEQITEEECRFLREIGVSKIEIGVQHTSDSVLNAVARGHKQVEVVRAAELLKLNGFKVGYHVMLGLPGSSLMADSEMLSHTLWQSEYHPDYLKVYPCTLLKDKVLQPGLTKLHDQNNMSNTRAIAVMLLFFTCLPLATVTVAAPAPFFSCTNYHCDEGQTVQLSEAQWQSVRELFGSTSSAAEERQQLRLAIARLEQEVGAITGTWRDLAENVAGAGLPGQLDCIAESKNTTTYLKLLRGAGLLKWHSVEARAVRHPLIFNVHWSAVIRDTHAGEQYAVDSWFLDNGRPPYIQPLDEWKAGHRF